MEDSDLLQGLSNVEKVLVRMLHRVEIRGKKERMVPVLLTESLQESIEVLVNMRL